MSFSLERKVFRCLSARVQSAISDRIQGMLLAAGEIVWKRGQVVGTPKLSSIGSYQGESCKMGSLVWACQLWKGGSLPPAINRTKSVLLSHALKVGH